MNSLLRRFILISVPTSYIFFMVALYFVDGLTIDYALPLELCNVTLGAIWLAFLLQSKQLLHLVSYPAVIGAVVALLYRGGCYSINWVFAIYFIGYHLILLGGGLYSFYLRKWKVKPIEIVYSMSFVSACAIVAAMANIVTGGNYMFLKTLILPIPAPWYYIVLFAAMLISISLVYVVAVGIHWLISNYSFKKQVKNEQIRRLNS